MKRKSANITDWIPAGTALLLFFLIWWVLSACGAIPAYMLPSPVAVIRAFIEDFSNLMFHARVSLQEAFYGLLVGILLAFFTATAMDRFSLLEKALNPLLVISQTIDRKSVV